ncbi:hypothetical protein [Paenibacillus sp. 481]|uniref:hypothetical protein n=1 Tax=Paenibacillus sp. 481 TaxID=2835869 RepID=UPI001E4ECFDA|nr:hypothetical protein [Paenibacillus sp. 481]UHA74976.1 hypothetical protein KIK04_08080 [Paenibacillus sp. 481]
MLLKKAPIIASTLALSLLFTVNPASAQASEMKKTEMKVTKPGEYNFAKIIPIKDIDKKVVDAAYKAMKPHSNGKVFKLEYGHYTEVDRLDGTKQVRLSLQAKKRAAVIELDMPTGKIVSIGLKFNTSELKGEHEKHYKMVKDSLQKMPLAEPIQWKQAALFINKERNREMISFSEGEYNASDKKIFQYVTFNIKDRKLLDYQFHLDIDKMDPKYSTIANNALKKVLNGTEKPFRDVFVSKMGESHVYQFQHLRLEQQGKPEWRAKQSVMMSAATGKVYSVSNGSEVDAPAAEKSLTNQEVIQAASPLAKSVFGIDLSTYTVKADNPKWREYRLSKKGKESVKVQFSPAGTVSRMELDIPLDKRV